ncbi:uncharacterized protein LOC111712593 [Eurytemora carolleeae]|uniref:uncharacterized protein LOC111712593 n=1 Tax=Eurytemora carolleeae TaxID=1294199 RepID=UPI000C761DB2|nr:uncharacterized protein LOC111712593 [Eurytemora carolleeae]|eukprot:XP_023343016.1 uncharacterized protein LOC111712593 [Eurytemora affinis]
MFLLLIWFFGLFCPARGDPIDVYFLNKHYDLRANDYFEDKEHECVITPPGAEYRYSQQMTLCWRQYPIRYEFPTGPYSGVISLGTLNSDRSDFDVCRLQEGLLYGNWDNGPWFGFKSKDNPEHIWVGMGTNVQELQIWQHTCLSLDMKTGDIRLSENGVITFATSSSLLKGFNTRINDTFKIAAPGCSWRKLHSKYQSIYGKVTDFQVFSTVLAEEEMNAITGKYLLHQMFTV